MRRGDLRYEIIKHQRIRYPERNESGDPLAEYYTLNENIPCRVDSHGKGMVEYGSKNARKITMTITLAWREDIMSGDRVVIDLGLGINALIVNQITPLDTRREWMQMDCEVASINEENVSDSDLDAMTVSTVPTVTQRDDING